MLQDAQAFSGYSVKNIDETRAFYGEKLGLEIEEGSSQMAMLWLKLKTGKVLLYAKDDHTPATFTVLNFTVSDVEHVVDELAAKGVAFEHYDGTPMQTDDKGIFRGGGPLIAWFKDPSDNVLSVIAEG